MNDNIDEYGAYEKRLSRDKMVYKFVFGFTLGLILFSIWFAYNSMQTQSNLPREPVPESNEEDAGKTKALPDFIIDKVEPDELDMLKP